MKASWIVAFVGLLTWAPRAAAQDYLPLQEGNRWTYALSSGVEMEVVVTGFELIGGVRCAVLETTVPTPLGPQTMTECCSSGPTGILAHRSQDVLLDPPQPRLRLPFVVDETWKVRFEQDGMPLEITYRSAARERVETPAGSFDALRVDGRMRMPDGSEMTTTTWFVDGVGYVRQVMSYQLQELVAELASTNVRPPPPQARGAQRSGLGGGAQPATGTCPACGVPVPSGARFCPQCGAKVPEPQPQRPSACPACGAALGGQQRFCSECGERIEGVAPPAAPSPAQAGELERYASADGRLVCFKPRGWRVEEESGFAGAGSYRIALVEPQEAAVVVFVTFGVVEGIDDSVMLAAQLLQGFGEEFEELQVARIESSPDRARTIAELSLTSDGQRGTGHAYFFLTDRLGTMFLLLARQDRWDSMRQTLTTVAANLAYAPGGVEGVLRQGQAQAEQGRGAVAGRVLSPAAMLQAATKRPGRQLPCMQVGLPDGSLELQIPRGWSLEGQGLQYVVIDDPRARMRGYSCVWHTVIPTGMQVPGAITSAYQPPPEALRTLVEMGRVGTGLEILGQCSAEGIPEVQQVVRQQQAAGMQVDVRLLHVRFRSLATGEPLEGLFNVSCSVSPMSSVWQIAAQGCWAPQAELDELLPLYLRLGESARPDPAWLAQDATRRDAAQRQQFARLQDSIAGANQAFDQYLDSVQAADRSRDYTSWAWSQTTLGQGTWVAENEGARVYQTDSWGLQGPEGRVDSPAYNTTSFTGESPWGGQLERVDTRAEYERYVR